MKILFYNHTGQASGAERLLLMILSRLDRQKFDPVMVCPDDGPLMQLAAELAMPVETMASLQARFTWRVDRLVGYLRSFLQVIRQFRQKVISIEPDLIHANSIRAGVVATAATVGLRTRVAWHVHDLLPRHPLSTAVRLLAFLSTRTRMIAVSGAVAHNFVGAFSPWKQRVAVILNGIELDKFRPKGNAGNGKQDIRSELQLGNADPLIGIVGQLTPRKGQLELLRAFADVWRRVPRAVLLIVGAPLFNRDEEYAELLKQTASELGIAGRVRLTGPRSDVPAIMRELDLLVVNSSAEPFGLVVVEAMACGTPILAAACGGIPEIIEHGKTGWLVPPRDEQTLAETIVSLSRQPALLGRLAEQGKTHVRSRFSADRYMSELQAFYGSNAVRSRSVDIVARGVREGECPANLRFVVHGGRSEI
ncbi:MAG: glycosyltransferase family 4 protein [Acidobacteriota bacterium]